MASNANLFPELDRKGYRDFGLTTGGIVAGLFGLFFPFVLDASYPIWPWIIFAVLGGMALAVPMALAPIYKYWMKFGHFMGTYIMTPLIMMIVFFGMFMPIGYIMRWSGKDAMARKLDDNANTYRVPSDPRPVKNLEKPF